MPIGAGSGTHDRAQYRYLRGLQRTKRPEQIRGLNQNHSHEMKEIFKGAATRASCSGGAFSEFCPRVLYGFAGKWMKPRMMRLTLSRKIAEEDSRLNN